jgi:molybdenum cofactor synthesis domain-containing protein
MRFGIVTVSDRSSRGERPDTSGPALENVVTAQGWQILHRQIIPDNFETIRQLLADWSDSGELDVILTTGGTGFSPRDVTPEATHAVVERPTPGIAEAMRAASLAVTPHAMLSRAAAGIRRRTLIVNLPGSPKGAVENLQVILPVLAHAIALLSEDPGAEAGHTVR